MFLYNKSMMKNFKFPFNGLETIERNYSQAMQDLFVLSVLNGKRWGTFLEIGSSEPINISNTYLLEKYFSWEGISIDLIPNEKEIFESAGRTAKVIVGDAVSLDYNVILSEFDSPRIDYLQIDIDPSIQSLNCLKILPLDNFRFSCISFEDDVYDPANTVEYNQNIKRESQEILKSHGYVLVNDNVANMGNDPFEQWWLDGTYFDKSTIDKFMREDDSVLMARHYMWRNVE
jgi:hypothetical protein